jgi:hypothetical protein
MNNTDLIFGSCGVILIIIYIILCIKSRQNKEEHYVFNDVEDPFLEDENKRYIPEVSNW